MSHQNPKELQESIKKALVDTTRTASQLANEDLAFHRSLSSSLSASLDQQGGRLLGLARDLTRAAISDTSLSLPDFRNVDSIDDDWRKVVDVFDNLLERADASLDEYTGVIKRPKKTLGEQAQEVANSSSKQKPSQSFRSLALDKPQLQFASAPANHDETPFKPILRNKPHALTPLADSLKLIPSEDGPMQYAFKIKCVMRSSVLIHLPI